ncbi:MAG: type ISP restriction/modification enzyme, partial [Promethearchaeota archaeon]
GEESVFITKNIAESHFIEGGSGIGDYLFPLKINAEISRSSDWEQPLDAKKYNFAPEFMQFWQERYGLDEEDCFYYIYGILWTPEYRTLYKPFLKKDFPHIPFSLSKDYTKKIANLGRKLSELHTLSFSSEKINKWPTGSCKNYLIQNIYYDSKKNRVYFDKPNDKQLKINGIQKDKSEDFFWIGDITPQMWGFSIGGVPQLSLWLKNRKFSSEIKKYSFNRAITKEELKNFLKICFSIKKTIELMKKLSIYYQN